MKLFARPKPVKDLSPQLAELRSRLKTVEADKQKAEDKADDLAVQLADSESKRDKLADVCERRRLALETLTAERDKALQELADLRIRMIEEAAGQRKLIETERQQFARSLDEIKHVSAEREAFVAKRCGDAETALKDALVALGR